MKKVLICILLASLFSACSSHSTAKTESPIIIERPATPPPGTVQYIWEEPMVDVVDVPPGLDPEGHYYRPAHQSVVEVRQGRWKHYDFPDEQAK